MTKHSDDFGSSLDQPLPSLLWTSHLNYLCLSLSIKNIVNNTSPTALLCCYEGKNDVMCVKHLMLVNVLLLVACSL